jgi:hypothetical protein
MKMLSVKAFALLATTTTTTTAAAAAASSDGWLCADPTPSPGCPFRSDTTMRSEEPHDLRMPPASRFAHDEVRECRVHDNASPQMHMCMHHPSLNCITFMVAWHTLELC